MLWWGWLHILLTRVHKRHLRGGYVYALQCPQHEPCLSGCYCKTKKTCRDTINIVKDLINMIRGWPKRLAWFDSHRIPEGGNSLLPLCPTRCGQCESAVWNLYWKITWVWQVTWKILPKIQEASLATRAVASSSRSGNFLFYFILQLWMLWLQLHPLHFKRPEMRYINIMYQCRRPNTQTTQVA